MNPNNRIIVFIYLSSYEKVEVDTWNIISELLKDILCMFLKL